MTIPKFSIQRICVVGARGRMGTLFVERSRAIGLDVAELDQPISSEEPGAAVDETDLVLLAVPAAAMRDALDKLRPLLRPPQILSDIVSVKERPLRQMSRTYDGPVVGLHPLFGPAPEPGDNRVAVMDGRDPWAVDMVEAWLTDLGMAPFRTTAEEHDWAMAQIQGLNFVTTVSYLASLAHQPELRKFLTPSFQRRLDAAGKMLTQDAEMFAGLFEANPHSQDAVRRFRNFLHVAAGGDVDLLIQRAQWWFGVEFE